MINCNLIHKSYQVGFLKRTRKNALNGVTLQVGQNEVFGIIGLNGAGKSSLLKIFMGFIRQDSGTALIAGTPASASTNRHLIGYLPEHPSLYPNLSITEHLQFGCRIGGMTGQETKNRIQTVLETVGLADAAKTPIKGFSKGMTQRAALAYAILLEPEILILDEPMSGLDPLGRQLVIDIIQEYRGKGTTILFCSHILTDVERICDRIGIMHRGSLATILTTPIPGPGSGDHEFFLPRGWKDPVGITLFAHRASFKSMKIIWPIALITLKEGLRQRLLYGIIVVSLLLILFAVLISGLFMRDILKILLDICLSTVSIGGLLVPFALSINLLAGDIEKRTIYTLLSRNISRNNYILGKFLGLALITGIVMALLTLSTLLATSLASLIYPAHFFEKFSPYPVLLSTLMAFLGVQVLNSSVFLWCSVTTSSFLATLLTLSTYLIGHSVEDVVRFISLKIKGVEIAFQTQLTAKMALYIFPNLAAFDLKQQAVYSLPISLHEISLLGLYGIVYISIMLLLASFFFRQRDLP